MIQSHNLGNIAQEENNNIKEIDFDKENIDSTLYWSPEQEQDNFINKKSSIILIYNL